MDILGQSALLLGVISFALGSSVLSKNIKNKLFIGFCVLTALISAWSLSFFLEKLWETGSFYSYHLFFNLWITPAAIAFIHLMIRIRDPLSRRLLEISIILACTLTVALVFGYQQTNVLILHSIYLLPSLVVTQILILMLIDRRIRRGMKFYTKFPPKLPTVGLSRRNWIYFGGLIVLLTCSMDHYPIFGKTLPAFGNFALCIYIFFMSQAITQQRLLNLSALFSRVSVLLLVSLVLTVFYTMLVGWIQNSTELFFLNSFIASFLIITLLDPIRSLVGYITQRLSTPEYRRLETIIREAQRSLATVTDLPTLFNTVLFTVEQTLRPESAALYVLRSDGTKLRRVRWSGQEPHTEMKELLVNHSLLQFAQDQKKKGELPILLDQILLNEIDRSASRPQREHLLAVIQALKALGCNMLIPLFDEGEILGCVAVSVPAPPEPWGSNWGLLPIIFPYFELAAKTMQSMEIYARQREKERLATIGQLAAGLAHEIRNPLGAIKGAAQFLDPSLERPESKFLKVIIDEVDRLNRVVSQFLDYSKPRDLDLKTTDVSLLVEKTIEFMKPTISSDIQVKVLKPTHSVLAEVSSEQLKQVLINLIQNSIHALKESKNTHKNIILSLEDGKEISISVEDNGMGIKRENLDKLFIPFFTTSPSGTGLGLSISQKIIEAHKGRIEVNSEEGKFTRFSIVLPPGALLESRAKV